MRAAANWNGTGASAFRATCALFALLLGVTLACGNALAQGRGRGGGGGGGGGVGRQDAGLKDRINEAQVAGDLVLAEQLARQRIELNASAPRRQANAYRQLGGILRKRGRLPDAEAMLRAAQPVIERENGRDSRQAVRGLLNIAEVQKGQSRYAEAATTLQEALARQLRFAPDFQDTIKLYLNLADLQRRLQRFGEAEALLKQADAVPGRADASGNDTPQSLGRLRAKTTLTRAELLLGMGRAREAEPIARSEIGRAHV